MKLDEFILKSDGKFVSVGFVKKDGETRILNGRLGVKKYLKGGTNNINPDDYITIYDVQAHGYRNINRKTIKWVKTGGLFVLDGALNW